MLSLVLGSVRTRRWQYLGVLVVTLMTSALLTTLGALLRLVDRAHLGQSAVKSAASLLGLVGGTSGLTALLLVGNTLALVVQQRRREIGALRAIGATPAQIRWQLVGEAVAVAVPGAVAGAAVGTVAVAPVLGRLVRDGVLPAGPATAFALPESVPVSVPGVALGVLSTVLLAVLAALVAVRAPLRMSPVAALREAVVERRTMPAGRAVAAVVLTVLTWAAWDGYGHRGGPRAAVNGSMALCLLALLSAWLFLPLLVRPVAALSALPGCLLSRCTGRLAAANSASAGRRVAALAGPVLIAAGLSAMLWCGHAVSRSVDAHRVAARPAAQPAVTPSHASTGDTGISGNSGTGTATRIDTGTGKEAGTSKAAAGTGREAGARADRDAAGMRVLMAPLILFSGTGIVNTLLLATRQRRQEFAVLRLTGSTGGQLLRMLGWESVVVVLTGLLTAGAVVALFLAGLSRRLALTPAELVVVLPWGTLARIVAGCALLGLLGVLVPGGLALRVRPVRVAREKV
ncbi:FtsX-like permease family protein [Streptomyces celluloflavus]